MDVGNAVVAGLVGTVVMTALLYMGIALMPRQMTMNILWMEGSMVAQQRPAGYGIGAMMHVVMGIVFALVHVAIYQAAGLTTGLAAWGLLFGVGHWAIAGAALGMLPGLHPLIKRGELAAPGAFAIKSPPLTAMGFLMLHLVFGVAVGVVYEALA